LQLQEALASGKLAPGLNREVPVAAERTFVNNKVLLSALAICQSLARNAGVAKLRFFTS